MNLLKPEWISVSLRNGTQEAVSVSALGREDIVDITAPRADFRGAIYQLLVGLLQTAFAPKNHREWRQWWGAPPDAKTLEKALAPFVPAFNLFSSVGEPAFMQDLTLEEGEQKDIAALFIEAPGSKTLRDNQDHFVKRGAIGKLSPEAAALALFTLQINASSGGAGHRVSVRGGGPLTTLLLPSENSRNDCLWRRLWLNVLTKDDLAQLPGDHQDNSLGRIFPWMASTRTSEKKGMETYPNHAHPLQVYWSMPRRMRLQPSDQEGRCDLTGQPATSRVDHYLTKNYGINYAGHWQHPLTPYVFESNKEPLSIKAQPGGLGYRHWLGLAVTAQQGKFTRTPALVVRCYFDRQDRIQELDLNPRLWAFGYDMDNMKARCWYETEMPLFNLTQEAREDIAEQAQIMIEAATDVLKTLKSALKSAWFDRPKDAKGDMSFIDANFWSVTETSFYRLLQQLVEKNGDDDAIDALLKSWARTLKDKAQKLFDQYALSSLNEDGDLKRVVKARDGKGGLNHHLNGSRALKKLAA
ncbi:type I-E CRISPR-associated protein Cse1/CasA [Thiolapillus sp.]|uniref:type I-E CRISPR-associated protein Cse1/CasA n=8 Tax=Thiolapillus sp. TaxID=2017437 RepID=UPI0025FBD6CB|nr:type I-E CRISPR-associated protein Cse1/CasA [Thiolapillus sp.]